MKQSLLASAAVLLLTGAYAQAEGGHSHHLPEPMVERSDVAAPSTQAYEASMHAMHEAMDIDYTGDIDADFARGMVPHHEGAVEMAKVELAYGSDPDLLKLAERIVWAQNGEIGQMRRWLYTRGYIRGTRPEDCCKLLVDPGNSRSRRDDEAAREFILAAESMHEAMNVGYTGDADIDFVRGMIPHHQGAVDMAYVELRHGRSPELLALASSIIRDQKAEISMMEDRLEALTRREVADPRN